MPPIETPRPTPGPVTIMTVYCPRAGTWLRSGGFTYMLTKRRIATAKRPNIKVPTTTCRNCFRPCHHNETSSTSIPSLTLSLLSASPRTSVEHAGPSSGKLPVVSSGLLIKRAESTEMVESLVTAVLLTARMMMRNGAMTCCSPRLDNNVQGFRRRQENAKQHEPESR